MKTILIDNYDSYTFNLYQMIAQVNGEPPIVIHNDQFTYSELQALSFDNIVISPGPGRPENQKDFGICQQVIKKIGVPLLGICLGHQGIGYVFGGQVIYAPEAMHGRLSRVYHDNSEIFADIPQNFCVVRYHSLIVAPILPESLKITAWTADGIIMGLRHQSRPIWGVQFHPESISTEYGYTLLENFRNITKQYFTEKDRRQSVMDQEFSIVPTGYFHQFHNLDYQVYSRQLNIDRDPEQVFVHLFGDKTPAFWLDSSLADSNLSRFSFMGDGCGPNSRLIQYNVQTREVSVTQGNELNVYKESILDYLKRELELLNCYCDSLPFDFNCGFAGYFGYEIKAECGSTLENPSSLPDSSFILADRLIVFDHQELTTYVLCLMKKEQESEAEAWFDTIEQKLSTLPLLEPPTPKNSNKPVTFRFSRSYQTYLDNIQHCLYEISEGESYEVCLTNKISTDSKPDPLTLYRILRKTNPAPYSAFFRFEDLVVLSSSPERFLKIDRNNKVESKPIKGTKARGINIQEDQEIQKSLKNGEKDRAENLMIVDLLRNDLGHVCEIGSVHVPKLMDIETYATVHQLVSTICGHLRKDLRATDCIRVAFPGGSMTGAPKLRTMEIIDRLEGEARGIYSGAIGFLGLNGTADLNIVIRTIVMTPTETTIGVGGAIVALSDPQIEFDEILLKAQALIRAILLTVHGEINPNLYHIMDIPLVKQTVKI
ncbi:aminodeoxychorismate synthase component I [Cyanobacterium sp. uoEpiScrs1]|uniref:aminodeoxychorismate synthase component I n=1 Tax=Cyanobacterium sp. uoEpiScrs1 TaxID=2976343 RepID=UPI002269CECA|nr:aminodeoxychorismate synthase component I [Cyanobacterium sp. uoEpiScrs1]